MIRLPLIVLAVCLYGTLSFAGEVEECRKIAEAEGPGWIPEARMIDGTRVDLLTSDTAWEVDWLKDAKHYEAIGQALWYAELTNRRGGVILLVKPEHKKNLNKAVACAYVCGKLGLAFRLHYVD